MELGNHVYQQLRKGNIQAFREVFDTYSDRIYSVAYRILKNREQAEEIVQETFLKVWQNREKLDETKAMWPFIFVVAKRLCFNQLRSIRYDVMAQKELIRNMKSIADDHPMDLRDMERLLQDSVVQLPARQRQVWIMSREQGKSHKEIADELGISPNTVKNNMVQTLKTLRDVFTKADYLYFFIFLYFV
ncbi:MAG: RNA polymerase sigma-70 factor [Sphingobacterium sp.]